MAEQVLDDIWRDFEPEYDPPAFDKRPLEDDAAERARLYKPVKIASGQAIKNAKRGDKRPLDNDTTDLVGDETDVEAGPPSGGKVRPLSSKSNKALRRNQETTNWQLSTMVDDTGFFPLATPWSNRYDTDICAIKRCRDIALTRSRRYRPEAPARRTSSPQTGPSSEARGPPVGSFSPPPRRKRKTAPASGVAPPPAKKPKKNNSAAKMRQQKRAKGKGKQKRREND